MIDFKDTARAREEAAVRRAIRKAGNRLDGTGHFSLSRDESAVLLALANLQMHHHPAAIHPGHARMAKVTAMSEATICRYLRKFESLGIIVAVASHAGGWSDKVDAKSRAVRSAICYRVELELIRDLVDPLPATVDGELVPLKNDRRDMWNFVGSPYENGFHDETQNGFHDETQNGFQFGPPYYEYTFGVRPDPECDDLPSPTGRSVVEQGHEPECAPPAESSSSWQGAVDGRGITSLLNGQGEHDLASINVMLQIAAQEAAA